MLEAMPIIGKDVEIVGANDYAATKASDIIIITAGLARKPGMSRDDLLTKNAEIVGAAATETLKYSPDAIYIVLTNPLDTMAYLTMKKTGLPRERVIGQAGILDSARMRAFVALETGVSVENINCYVLGGHGDEMVPLTRHSNVAGIPLNEYLPADKLDAIVARTRKGGGEIVNLVENRFCLLCAFLGLYANGGSDSQEQTFDRSLCGLHGRRVWLARICTSACRSCSDAQAWKRLSSTSLMRNEKAMFEKSAASVKETHEALKKLVTF